MLRKISTILIMSFTLSLFLSVSVYAQNRDFYDMKNKKVYKADIWRNSDEEFNKLLDEVMERPDDFNYEFKGKTYNYSKLLLNINLQHNKGFSYSNSFLNALKIKEIQEDIPNFTNNIKFEVISIE